MCGIVGYVGDKDARPILLDGLRRLEYRGYDSAGIAAISRGQVAIRKCRGKISHLGRLLERRPLACSHTAIAHTRWATHGAPLGVNAHPHPDCRGDIALVHNGIIENHASLKDDLIKKGHRFRSQTDTEVIVHLIEDFHKRFTLDKSVRLALARLRGSFALAVLSRGEPQMLIGARRGSPLVVGLGRGENFLASDVSALLDFTRRVIFLEDNRCVVLGRDKIEVTDLRGKAVKARPRRIDWDAVCAQKGGYPHFMLKEIYEQPQVLRRIFSFYIKGSRVDFGRSGLRREFLRRINNVVIIACGTAYHAGLVGRYALEQLARMPVAVDVSSEFRYRNPIIDKNTLVLAISQSGETADTLAAAAEAEKAGAKVLALCNVVGSSLSREADFVVYTLAGPEIGVASTKAYTAQVALLYLLALFISAARGKISSSLERRLIGELRSIAARQECFLRGGDKAIIRVARRHHRLGSFLYLGRRVNYPVALEGALKLKEISYIPAEGYAAGEMKHGPIALIDEYRAVVCIAVDSDIYPKMISNIREISARRGKIVAIASEGDSRIKDYVSQVIYIPRTRELFSCLLTALPLQLLAYHIAVIRGCDVDQPRNLAKSVTVE